MDDGKARAGSFSRSRIWAAVLILTLVGIINTVDRLLVGILIEPIKHDLRLSDTAIGLINGFGFLLIYAAVGLPIARVADRGAYGLVIASCLALWSLMTVLGSFAHGAWQFAFSRLGVALGEAGSAPAAHAFIAANFAATRRGVPLAVLTLSLPIAILAGTWGGAVLGHLIGWRATFFVMGSAGVLLSPLVLLVLGRRQLTATVAQPPSLSLIGSLVLLKKSSFLVILMATACISIGGYSLGAFGAAFLMRVHGMPLGEVGRMYGIASGGAGAIGLVIAGIAADRLAARDPRWSLWVVALMIALLMPAAYAAFLVPGASLALVLMALIQIIGVAYFAPVIAAIQRLVPPHLRATASAMLLSFSSVAGGLGPLITGLISDALQPHLGGQALGRAMLIVPIAYTCAGVLFAAASLTFRKDMVAEDNDPATGISA